MDTAQDAPSEQPKVAVASLRTAPDVFDCRLPDFRTLDGGITAVEVLASDGFVSRRFEESYPFMYFMIAFFIK